MKCFRARSPLSGFPASGAPRRSRRPPPRLGETDPFDSFKGSLKINSQAIAVVTGIDLTLANGIEPQYAIFDRSAKAVSWGRSTLTGTLSAFYVDGTFPSISSTIPA